MFYVQNTCRGSIYLNRRKRRKHEKRTFKRTRNNVPRIIAMTTKHLGLVAFPFLIRNPELSTTNDGMACGVRLILFYFTALRRHVIFYFFFIILHSRTDGVWLFKQRAAAGWLLKDPRHVPDDDGRGVMTNTMTAVSGRCAYMHIIHINPPLLRTYCVSVSSSMCMYNNMI